MNTKGRIGQAPGTNTPWALMLLFFLFNCKWVNAKLSENFFNTFGTGCNVCDKSSVLNSVYYTLNDDSVELMVWHAFNLTSNQTIRTCDTRNKHKSSLLMLLNAKSNDTILIISQLELRDSQVVISLSACFKLTGNTIAILTYLDSRKLCIQNGEAHLCV